jgi:hypothetical protein
MRVVRRLQAVLLAVPIMLGTSSGVGIAGTDDAAGIGLTPPRLSLVEGGVSFWRPGTATWAPAELNTPLGPGDQLGTAHDGTVELQVASQGFVRGWGDTQFLLARQGADHLQLSVSGGHVAVDLRNFDPGQTVTIETPHAIYTLSIAGYYRTDVTPGYTAFTTRAGRATVTRAARESILVGPGERAIVASVSADVTRERAPAEDAWDAWNRARTDHLVAAASARYVADGVYGASDLDQYGDWRVTGEYGPVWVPAGEGNDWTPYSHGRWINDPAYGWTWVDDAPWGWAPYHYGRWVFVDGVWAWAPGAVAGRWSYAPALVAFLTPPSGRVEINAGVVSWVPLGWREPLVPWWGRRQVRSALPTVYRNAAVRNGVVSVRADDFTRRRVDQARLPRVDVRDRERGREHLDAGPLPHDRHAAPIPSAPTTPRTPAVRQRSAPVSPETVAAPPRTMPIAPEQSLRPSPASPRTAPVTRPPASVSPRTSPAPALSPPVARETSIRQRPDQPRGGERAPRPDLSPSASRRVPALGAIAAPVVPHAPGVAAGAERAASAPHTVRAERAPRAERAAVRDNGGAGRRERQPVAERGDDSHAAREHGRR